MTGLTLEQIAALCGGAYAGPEGGKALQPNELVIDSRLIGAGNLFAALPGEKVDGHAFVEKALAAGAAGALVTHVPEGVSGPCVVVPDVAKAMADIAEAYRNTLRIPVIGITGSVGKTTMKEMVAAVLGARYRVLKTEKNFNNDLGVPMTVSRIQPEHQVAVVEMGISHFGEMEQLGKIVRPTDMVYTVIGHSHLEALHDRNGVLKAKTEHLHYMPATGTLYLNGDDDLLAHYQSLLGIVTFGTTEESMVHAENVRLNGMNGTICDIVCGDRRIPVEIHAYGKQMVTAALGAAAVAMNFGMSDKDIIAGIGAYQPVGGRANVTDTGYLTVINDCYNANPDSMGAALESLAMLEGKKAAILGDMYELGPDSVEMHRAMGEKAAHSGLERVITCGMLGRDIGAAAKENGAAVTAFDTKEELIAALPQLVEPGMKVLVKASHGLHLEQVVEALEHLK